MHNHVTPEDISASAAVLRGAQARASTEADAVVSAFSAINVALPCAVSLAEALGHGWRIAERSWAQDVGSHAQELAAAAETYAAVDATVAEAFLGAGS